MEINLTQADVVIVGGGLAGLSAACYLGRAGARVTLFEKAASLGGRASTQNYDGYMFNRGIHALYTGGAASEVLHDLGISYSYGIAKGLCLLHEGQIYPLPLSPSSLLKSRLLKFGDKIELARFFSMLPRLRANEVAHISVQEWLERTIRRPMIRQLMNSTARVFVYSTALDLVSAEVFVSRLQIALKHPVHYIEGGWQTLVEKLRQAAEQAGVRIVQDSRIVSVEHQHGEVQGVRLHDGRVLAAANVILATNSTDAVKLVDEGAYAPLCNIVDPLIPARVACLDVALRRLPDPRHPAVQDLDGARFLSAHSCFTRVAPENGALISTFKQLDPMYPGDAQQDERDLEDLLDTVQPGWRDLLVKRVFLPRIEAMSMLPLASSGGYAGRPGPLVPGINRLYLAGDWIGAGFLADPSMGSARHAAQLILQNGSLTTLNKTLVGSV